MVEEKEVEILEVEQSDSAIDMDTIQEMATTGKDLLSQINPSMSIPQDKPLISDEKITGLFDEVLNNLRSDRSEIDDVLTQIKDMVLNGGDATTSSKEAVVNLIKIKTDTADKMAKIVDLMVRSRGVNTMPRWMAAQQNNTINIGDTKKSALTPGEKRALIEQENRKMELK